MIDCNTEYSQNKSGQTVEAKGDCYNVNVPFVLQFMIEKDLAGMGWISLQNYTSINDNFDHMSSNSANISNKRSKESYCNFELIIDQKDINPIPWKMNNNILPLRMLVLDIECLNPLSGKFPTAENDPIISIGVICTDSFKLELSPMKYVLQLGDTKPIQEAEIIVCESEYELINMLHSIIIH